MRTIIGILVIPAIMLATYIVPAPVVNHEWVVPDNHAGQLEGVTRTVLAGHTPGVFERLNELAVGDIVRLHAYGGEITYRVIWLKTVSDDWTIDGQDRTPLVLVTCDGDSRLLIGAELIS